MAPTSPRCLLCDAPNPDVAPACPGCGAPWTPAAAPAPRWRLRWPRVLAAGLLLTAGVAGAALGGPVLAARLRSAPAPPPVSCEKLCPGGTMVHTRAPWACGTSARRMWKQAKAAQEQGCPCRYVEVEAQ